MGTWGQGSTPDDGFISRLGADGRVLDLRWVTGFDSPKGLALANGRLYVAEDADLVEIDPGAGVIVARHKPADGPGGFNDCTADARGTVYIDGIEPDGRGGYTVTDWVTGDVLRVSADGVPTRLLTLRQGAADHLYVVDQRLLVVPLVRDHAAGPIAGTPRR